MKSNKLNRKGSIVVLVCLLMLPMLALLAFAVDYGFLLFVRTDLQRTADQTALAAVRDLVPNAIGVQNTETVVNRTVEYAKLNMGNEFTVRSSDIEIGRYNPATIYQSVELTDDGMLDAVRVTVRRDDLSNNSVALYFARLFDKNQSAVTATSTAVLQRARYLGPGSSVFPFAMPDDVWDAMDVGDDFNIYGDGRIEDGTGASIPGNWGTVDIGPADNSTAHLTEQILNGLSQGDLNSLYEQGQVSDAAYIDSQQAMTLNADPGFSAGIRDAVEQVQGTMKLVPIYNSSALSVGNEDDGGNGQENGGGGGNNLSYEIIGWGAVQVGDSTWNGNANSSITVSKAYLYDAYLIPTNDLSDFTGAIDGAFTSPVLVQ